MFWCCCDHEPPPGPVEVPAPLLEEGYYLSSAPAFKYPTEPWYYHGHPVLAPTGGRRVGVLLGHTTELGAAKVWYTMLSQTIRVPRLQPILSAKLQLRSLARLSTVAEDYPQPTSVVTANVWLASNFQSFDAANDNLTAQVPSFLGGGFPSVPSIAGWTFSAGGQVSLAVGFNRLAELDVTLWLQGLVNSPGWTSDSWVNLMVVPVSTTTNNATAKFGWHNRYYVDPAYPPGWDLPFRNWLVPENPALPNLGLYRPQSNYLKVIV